MTLDAAWLKSLLQPAIAFRDTHNVPMWLDQWGVYADAGARPDDAAECLARAAFEKGSTDNITAVVVELPSTPAARSEPEAEAE